jgi:hypothetical protein
MIFLDSLVVVEEELLHKAEEKLISKERMELIFIKL